MISCQDWNRAENGQVGERKTAHMFCNHLKMPSGGLVRRIWDKRPRQQEHFLSPQIRAYMTPFGQVNAKTPRNRCKEQAEDCSVGDSILLNHFSAVPGTVAWRYIL